MHVNMLFYGQDEVRSLGTVRAVGGQLQIEGVNPLIQKSIEQSFKHMGLTALKFLLKMPELFAGSYVRARLERD